MAKGRNRERSQKKPGSGERGGGEAGANSGASGSRPSRPSPGGTVSPADVARRHQRRFGHN